MALLQCSADRLALVLPNMAHANYLELMGKSKPAKPSLLMIQDEPGIVVFMHCQKLNSQMAV